MHDEFHNLLCRHLTGLQPHGSVTQPKQIEAHHVASAKFVSVQLHYAAVADGFFRHAIATARVTAFAVSVWDSFEAFKKIVHFDPSKLLASANQFRAP